MKKLAISIVTATCLASAPAHADVATEMQNWFDNMGGFANATPPSSYKGQTMNGYSAGGFYARTPIKTYQLASITPPSISLGCGGIDITAGAFSFINKQALINFFKNTGSSLSYAFLLALKSSMPEMAGLFENLQDVANKVNAMQLNSCEAAKGIVSLTGVDAETEKSNSESHVAGGTTNMFSDALDSFKNLSTDPFKQGQAKREHLKTHPEDKNKLSAKNPIWNTLKKINGLTDEERQVLMGMSGTIVILPAGMDNAAPRAPSNQNYIPPTTTNLKSFIGEDVTKTTVDLEVLKCDEPVECLNPKPGKIKITTFLKRVDDATTNLKTKLYSRQRQNVATDFGLVEAAQLPVWKIISVSAETNPAMIDTFTGLIAVEMAHSYFTRMLQLSLQSTDMAKGSANPSTVIAAANEIRKNVEMLIAATNTMHIDEYKKAESIVDMERELQLMHQAMVAGIPAQAFNSVAAFGEK